MTLQDVNVRTTFVNDCANIWRDWLNGGAGRKARREAEFLAAINRMTSFMVAPQVSFNNTGGWGAFSWPTWRLAVNQTYTNTPNLMYKNFVELCSTVYHETRHAEQFYRIAQGLSIGDLKYPDTSGGQIVQMAQVAGSVRSRINMFNSITTGDPLQTDPGRRPGIIATWVNIPMNVAQHADNARNNFRVWTALPKPAWFKRPTVLAEVNEWMRATYKKSFSELDTWAQGDDGPYRVYRDLPEENDAHGIEDLVQTALYARIGNDTPANRKKRRDNVTLFGP